METILISKEKLLTKMRDNRTKHEQEYKKAMIGWKDQIHTKLSAILEKIQTDTDRDFFMSGLEAKEYGLVDHVITKRDDLDHIEKTEN